SLSITSFFYYFVVCFFGITKEIIYVYSLLLVLLFFLIKRNSFIQLFSGIKEFKLNKAKLDASKVPELVSLFILVFVLFFAGFSIPLNKIVNYDDSSYHLPIIYDIAEDGKKTFFSETHNIYQVRSNQFPLLFESFVGTTKFFLGSIFFWWVSFFSLILSLFLIYFIGKEIGYNELYSLVIYGLTPFVLVFSGYFGVENFLSLFFLASVFFVLKYVKGDNLFFLGVAGFCSGLMFLTKFTGGIFFVGLLLFLLFKKKFKPALFFTLIFVLVSSIFFVMHFTVPIGQESVGGYGELAKENFTEKILVNAFFAAERLFSYFASNFYIFFVPILFFFGLFWRKNNEKNFIFLLLISGFSLLSVTLVSNATPTYSGFPRYFWPVYSLLCIFSGIQLKKISCLQDKRISVFFGVLFVLIMLSVSIPLIQHFGPKHKQNTSTYVGKGIENDSNITVWFLNNASLHVRLDKVVAYDFAWRTDFFGDPCEFLQKHDIDYVVYYKIDNDSDNLAGSPDYLGDFGLKLREDLLNGKCSELISKSDPLNNASTFKITHKT
ncbi:glycosyltransferase family 39 protein, partial [Candidatus Micrarchaeota archaeon]|nr:glycosyltransferase family 39 protein [Candidatus Micrarchaeota archaeon]